MSNRAVIHTSEAPQAIGPYSQAVKANNTVWLSGQIPLDPATMELVEGDVAAQTEQVFRNLAAVARASGGDLNQFVKVNIYLTDLRRFRCRERSDGAPLHRAVPGTRLCAGRGAAARRGGGSRGYDGAEVLSAAISGA